MIEWFAKNGIAANLLMLGIIAAGAYSCLKRIGLEVFPDSEIDSISVGVTYRGSTPEEVEEAVLIPIEEAIQDIESVDRIFSNASEGSGSVTVELALGYDAREALDDIKTRVDAINTFPTGIERPNIRLQERSDSVVKVIVSGEVGERELRRMADQVRDEILQLTAKRKVPGLLSRLFFFGKDETEFDAGKINSVSLIGARPYEIDIEIPEQTLLKYDLTLDEVAAAVERQSVDLSAGKVKTQGGEILLRTKTKAYTGEEFRDIVIRSNPDGTKLTVGDLARVYDGFEETPVIARFDGEPAILLSVNRLGTQQDSIAISRAVVDYVEAKKPTLPQGLGIDYWRDRSTIVEGRLNTLIENAFWAFLLVFIVLALFLRISIAMWVALGIPVSFLGTLAVLPELGATLNISSLFGFILVLGIVVDDAIVTAENVYEKLKTAPSGLKAAIQGTKEVSIPVTFGVLTTVVAFVPLLLMTGHRGNMFKQISFVVIPVLIFSLIESKLILPAHLKHLKPAAKIRISKWNLIDRAQRLSARSMELFAERIYQPFLGLLLKERYVSYAFFVASLFVMAGWVFGGKVRYVNFPRVSSEYVTARLTMPYGTPSEITTAYIDKMEAAAWKLSEKYVDKNGQSGVEHIFSSSGASGLASGRGGSSSGVSHVGEVAIELQAPESRTVEVDGIQLSQEWRAMIGEIPGAEELNFRAEIGRFGDPVDVQIAGNDTEELARAAEAVKAKLAEYPALFDISSNFENGKEEIRLKLKPEAEMMGIETDELARQARGAFFGYEAQRLQRGREDVRVMVRYPLEERNSLRNLQDMRIRSSEGDRIPFTSLADLEVGRSFATIRRIDRNRVINITADLNKDTVDQEAIDRSLAEEIPKVLAEYPSVHFDFEGEAREQRETQAGLVIGGSFLLFALYALLAIPLKSMTQPLLIMSVIPFALIGAVLGHLFMDTFGGVEMPLSMMSLFGMLALAGVVVNDSLVMVDYVNQRRREGVSMHEAVRTGGVARFRPILLTSITTFIGLVPIIFEKSTQAQFLIPMAVSLGFGIVFATAVTLFIIPLQYLILEDAKRALRRGWRWYVKPLRRDAPEEDGNPTPAG